jgi:hypothetical protein
MEIFIIGGSSMIAPSRTTRVKKVSLARRA